METNATRSTSTSVSPDTTVSQDTSASHWRDLLVQETVEVDRAGVHAAVVAVRLGSEAQGPHEDERVAGLLRRRLRTTDRLGATAPRSFSMLLTPASELTNTVNVVRSFSATLHAHRISAVTAFAFRRPGENLIDTWARAEAELDRASYRAEHGGGISL